MRRALQLCVCACLYAADTESLIRRVAVYDFGSDPAAVRQLAAVTLRTGGGNDAAALEKLLIAGLGGAKTLAAKDALCGDLAIVDRVFRKGACPDCDLRRIGLDHR